ncbi:hypothetical protein FXB40_00780 [Bradyrhizobium rifense]|uniref:Uncharacterized protein n=1 Tax=Bradyrhizobium rifense TaxID=515499 RepID=A0A5D3L1Q5_9BRAD|nr:hypothetical protein [Bradyrhizobium rifense]TYM00093.1 hypothetical protein FXB40_00780 [Bradyrhizobium rifense]
MVALVRLAGAAAVVGVGVAIGVVHYLRGPSPLDFSGGAKVALADYRGADPTGVPADLSQASLVKRGEYLARGCTKSNRVAVVADDADDDGVAG